MADQTADTKQADHSNAESGQEAAHSSFFTSLVSLFAYIGEISILTGQTFMAAIRGQVSFNDLLEQMAAIGADSVWIVLVVTTAIGAVFSYYITNVSKSIGFTGFVGGTLSYAILNELGPVMGGVAFAARSGAAIAAEIGTMVVTEQVDALTAMGVPPVRYLVAPRVIAALAMLPLLIVLADFGGLWGGYVFSGVSGIPHSAFVTSVYTYTKSVDLINGLIKAVFFGYLIGTVACHQGLRTQGGATGVGRSTTNSVVLCVLLIFVSDFFLTQILTGPTLSR